jgi:hypothetical protein
MIDWTKFLESTVVKVGFPIVAAGVLIWFLMFTVNHRLQTLEATFSAHTLDSQALKLSVDSLQNSTDSLKNSQERTNLILQQICVNGAAVRDRPNCFR